MLKTIAQWFAARRPAPSACRAANKPSLETLEDRRCPAAWFSSAGTLVIQGNFSSPTDTVKITQDDARNLLTVIDNGVTRYFASSSVKQIDVKLGYTAIPSPTTGTWPSFYYKPPYQPYQPPPVSNFSYELVGTEYRHAKTINYTGSAALDTVSIDMTGGNPDRTTLNRPFHLNIDTGATAANDRDDGVFVKLPKVEGTGVGVYATLGAGNDSFGLSALGEMRDASVTVEAHGGSGNDRIITDLSRNLKGTTTFVTEATGGAGNDAILFRTVEFYDTGDGLWARPAVVKIDQDASLTVLMDGGSGNDNLWADYFGEVDGELGVAQLGGDGNDGLYTGLALQDGSDGQVAVLHWDWAGTNTVLFGLADSTADSDDLELIYQRW